MRENPRPGEFYRHFKNKLYQIIAVATHSESKEQLVIYQALYGDFGVYARPLDMFLSEVDREKYPDIEQKYRFEKLENIPEESKQITDRNSEINIEINNKTQQEESKDEQKNFFIDFLDADDYYTKKKILLANKENITDKQLDVIFDIYGLKRNGIDRTIDIADFIAYLDMQIHFEGKRLR
ncbi:DUF1653 domain-containing protein [Lachnoanaerobaculum gingivalis]|jgi:hypothetical protein|uniref:DUF1653 domain-containing protein n=1 Tax=Lachnoanaerobaculum gingivalis TaxID=2490855 RepID=UPI0024A68806|nr:DUF1653 domain-containing protein [Lachnoanaerobaculum gingivalis]WHE88633.1 DUF1653 domain-containing protein [Lachnoanaerobaculum gingivalis]